MFLAIPVLVIVFLYIGGLHQKIKHYENLMDKMEEDFEEVSGVSIYKFREMRRGNDSLNDS